MNQQTILDHTQDLTGSEQHRLTNLYQPPEFVKQASHEAVYGDPEALAPSVYALMADRCYPCHTKAATWMSALFFADKRRELTPTVAETVEQRLRKSASYWKIQPEVDALWEKMAAEVAAGVAQLPDSDFALVWEDEGGHKDRKYPLRNTEEVKMASDWFGRFHEEFAFGDKHQMASKILLKADELGAGVENSELLHKCAGYGYCAAEEAAKAWEKRAHLVQTSAPDYSAEALQVAQVVRSATFEARDQGKRIKMAELMDQFDRQTNLDALYGESGGLERPEDVLFGITEKVASSFVKDHIQTTTGAIYEKQALERLSLEDVQQWMGDEMAEEVSAGGIYIDHEKLADVTPTLPRPEAEMFEKMTRAVGVPVFAREKAAFDQGMSRDEMETLAAEYGQEHALDVDEVVGMGSIL